MEQNHHLHCWQHFSSICCGVGSQCGALSWPCGVGQGDTVLLPKASSLGIYCFFVVHGIQSVLATCWSPYKPNSRGGREIPEVHKITPTSRSAEREAGAAVLQVASRDVNTTDSRFKSRLCSFDFDLNIFFSKIVMWHEWFPVVNVLAVQKMFKDAVL